ncbi:MAG: hypothetical protein NVS1B14_09530 [Vulcanimicrobiaceae bacterium]
MKHCVRILYLAFFVALPSAVPAQVPPQAQPLLTLKMQAERAVNALLEPGQRQRVAALAAETEGQLASAFGNVQSSEGPLSAIFSSAQRSQMAKAAGSHRFPVLDLSETQMARLADYMRTVVMRAAPIWQSQSAHVNALLTPDQRERVNALRRTTLSQLPQLPMPLDVFGGLGTGDIIGGFASDPGSFVLLVSLPDLPLR